MRRILASLILMLSACSEKVEDVTKLELKFSDIANKIYDAKATRIGSGYAWVATTGTHTLTLSSNGDGTGTIELTYNNYSEPNFCVYGKSCTCSAIIDGTYTYQDSSSSDGTPSSTNTISSDPYNPLKSPTTTQTVATTTDTNVAKISYFTLPFTITTGDQDTSCFTQTDRNLYVKAFVSGEIVVYDTYREILFQKRTY